VIRCFALLAIPFALLLYVAGLGAPLYLDDTHVLASIRLSLQPRGLGLASFWLNDQINPFIQVLWPAAPDASLFRLGNVLIHALAATAVCWLAYELSRKWRVAWAAGMLFLVHPVQTQAVTYIAQRFEVQATLFMLLSAAAYARFRRDGGRPWLAVCLGCGAAAGLTKETAIVLPAWLVLVELIFFDRSALRKGAPYFAVLAAAIAYPALIALRNAADTLSWIPWTQYFLTQGPVLTKYLQILVYPRELFLFFDFPPVERFSLVFAAQWTFVLAVVAAGIYALRRDRVIGFGILTFFVLLLPVTLLPLPDVVFQYRLYPAIAGMAIATAAGLSHLQPRVGLALFLIILAPLQYRTMQRNRDWTDPVHFFEAHRERFPDAPIVLANLSVQYANHGMTAQALEASHAARRVEHRANPYYQKQLSVVVSTTLATEYLQLKQFGPAIEEAKRALALDPTNVDDLWVVGATQLETSDRAAAGETFRSLVAYDPRNRRAWVMLGKSLDEATDREAIADVQRQIAALDAAGPPTRARPQLDPASRNYIAAALAGLAALLLLGVAVTLRDVKNSLAGSRLRYAPSGR
jgi:tetratricopeptide (TPR) repeat protein